VTPCEGYLVGEWGRTQDNRRARYYKLTVAGRKQLGVEVEEYLRVNGAISRIIQPA
jgi:DNA-binding PadR family transcriptional regulator